MYLCIHFPLIIKDVIIIIIIIIIIISIILIYALLFIYLFFLTENIEKDNIDPHCNRFDLHFI